MKTRHSAGKGSDCLFAMGGGGGGGRVTQGGPGGKEQARGQGGRENNSICETTESGINKKVCNIASNATKHVASPKKGGGNKK